MVIDKGFAKKVLQKYNRDTEEEILEATYQYGLDYTVRPPYSTHEGVAEILRQTEHPNAKIANPNDFLDHSLIKSLEQAGYFAQR
jgi:predicted metal-dependent TIM-barrel fold hydrolase